MIVVGIDPGLSGAIAALRITDMGPTFMEAIDLPTCADGNQRQIDVAALSAWLERIEPDHCWIENVQPMPSIPDPGGLRRSMGATSAFRFGFACGQIRGCVQAYQIPITMVHPVSWKKWAGLKGPNKEQSRLLAMKLLESSSTELRLKKSHNKAESLLIALYGSNQMGFC